MGLLNSLFKEKTDEEIKEKKGYNPSFLSYIQPQGGAKFYENYIRKGDGYETVIHVYDFPTNVNDYWLEPIFNTPNVIVTVDVATEERSKAIAQVNHGIKEQKDRIYSEKDHTSQFDAASNVHSLEGLYADISEQGEVIKKVILRIFVSAKKIDELEDKVKEILEDLEGKGYQGTILLNEQKEEYMSLFVSADKQAKVKAKRTGKPMAAYTLAGSIPFNFSELKDPNGSYLGTTFTGGNVLFDIFHKTKKRRYYNAVVVGTMGAGKSTTLKKITVDNILRGNYIRGFDVVGEFEGVINEFGGKFLALDGSSGIINPLQVLKTSASHKLTDAQNEEQSFMAHLAKLSKFYKFVTPSAEDADIQEFGRVANKLYEPYLENIETIGITTLKNHEYPIISDLLKLVREELYLDLETKKFKENVSKSRVARLEKIELSLEQLVLTYGNMFNGHSSIEDIINEQIVFFSIRSISSFQREIFNAQMFNALSLLWDNMLQVGKPQMDALYDSDIEIDEDFIRRFLVIIDESHKVINEKNMLGVEYLTDFAREARKYFGGLIFASQSFRDFVPEGSSSTVVGAIKTLFELTQYKFLMQQDPNTLQQLRTIFEGQLSESELESIPTLEQGECVLSITGQANISFRVDASQEEVALFRGGM